MPFWMKVKQDEYYTPPAALDLLTPHLSKVKVYYDPFAGPHDGIVKYLCSLGYNVISTSDDFFEREANQDLPGFDCYLTNPPFSRKKDFLKVLLRSDKDFFVLLPTQNIQFFGEFKNIGMIVPRKRLDYISDENPTAKKGRVSFHSSFITNTFDKLIILS